MINRKITKAQNLVHQSIARIRGRSVLSTTTSEEASAVVDKKSSGFLKPLVVFARAVIENPRAMGAACPSSRRLAKAVTKFVPRNDKGLVIELGAGTGIVTEALLRDSDISKRLIAVERSPILAEHLRQHFPQLRLIEGDAMHLRDLLVDLLGSSLPPISTIICGLPLRSLPPVVVHGIVKQMDELLPEGGFVVQFTYDLMGRSTHLPHHFKRAATKIVWNNIPPARVNAFRSEAFAVSMAK